MEKQEKYTESIPVWRQVLQLRRRSPIAFATISIIMVVELLAVGVAPLFIPDNVYIKAYLNDSAEINTRRFLDGVDNYNIRDDLIGWRNKPGCVYGKWEVDEHGSRATHKFTTEPQKPLRVMFLGSSLINGGPFVTTDQSISALIEDSVIECINFGTMRYSLDQSYLIYKERLYKYNPDLLIVELGSWPCDGLENQYIPFVHRYAVDMPYLKPRYEMVDGKLNLIPMPPKWMHDSLFTSPALYKYLKNTDRYYYEFSIFERLGITPFANVIWFIYDKARNLYLQVNGDRDGYPLLEKLMQELTVEAKSHGASIIFLSLANRVITDPGSWRKLLPDHYRKRLDYFRSRGYQILDVREIFRSSGIPAWGLFVYDERHFTPKGNQLVAEKLAELIKQSDTYRTKVDSLNN